MRFSIKLVLLITALCAVSVTWISVRQQMIVAETQLLANTDWNEGSIKISEANGDQSYLTSDAAGIFHSAHIRGLRGLDVVEKERPDFRITSLSVASTDAFMALKPSAVPELERLYLDRIDFSQVTLEKLTLFPRLKELTINGRNKDPFDALSTLPSVEKPPLLMLDLPTGTDPRLSELKDRMPEYSIIVRER